MTTTAPQSPNYALSGAMGVDLNNTFTATDTSAGNSGYDNPPHAPGDIALGNNGTRWMYVLAATAININEVLCIDKGGSASEATTALASTGEYIPGFAQIAIASGSYGWVALNGTGLLVSMAASCTKDSALYTTATAGVLGTTSSSQTLLAGVYADTTTTSAASVPVIASAPRWIN